MYKGSKPRTLTEQVDIMWDTLHNHVLGCLDTQGTKLNFILGFLALQMGIMGIMLALVIKHFVNGS